MYGVGSTEFLIILVILLLLFGPTLIAFWLGYTLGKKRGEPEPASTRGQEPASELTDASASVASEEPAPDSDSKETSGE